ncbi:S8 family serine peptidase [Phormidium pseudopriestleyi FRX01]|uniref:S8 family serine peptidase n=1 Tax=Phormidium pseudopriestleyi FRX01 TaxID=1759528 RepID=A0ABS3FXJ1_9CYAN|nr:S8 family serine peptidase [Phormidium pseudopriestleyi]MBO0351542.1 S8 family serine peptidase [Phormidium pseudopriestleyi FRX01]
MTGQTYRSDTSQSNPVGIGVSDQSLGILLQRGGEELLLLKLSDRFTVRPLEPNAPKDWFSQIPATHKQLLHNTQLEEFLVEEANLEQVMTAVRSLPEVAFVSHVYTVDNNPQMRVYLTDEVTIQFAKTVDETQRQAIADTVQLDLHKPVYGIPNTFISYVRQTATENPIKIANRLMRKSEVLTAEPNIVITTQNHYLPRSQFYHKQWYLQNKGGRDLAPGSHIEAEKAWDVTRGIRSVVVAIADDAIDLNHPDFQGPGKVVAPRDFKRKNFLPLPEGDSDNHGTACAGVAVAEENGIGIVGVAPGCALMPIRTTGYLDDESIEQVFDWAITKGASVISCSWGASAVYFPLSLRQRAAITRAATEGRKGKGCVIVFAAGNANRPTSGTVNESGWPNNLLQGLVKWLSGFAVHPDVIAVSACTSLAKKAAYSNWGPSISLCAPSNNAPPGMWIQEMGAVNTPPEIKGYLTGLGIFTTDRIGSNGYDSSDYTGYFGGTSSACPVVAGVAALVLSVNPHLTAAQVKQILEQSADKIMDPDIDIQLGNRFGTYDTKGHSQWFGYGKVNAYNAVRRAQRLLTMPMQVTRQVQVLNSRRQSIPDFQRNQSSLFPLNLFGSSDRPGLVSEISISDPSLVADIRVTVDIQHSYLGDLELYLIAPNGHTVQLQSRTLGSQTRLNTTYSLQNTPTLRQLCNQSAKGSWKLWVTDCVPADTGTLNSWDLILAV